MAIFYGANCTVKVGDAIDGPTIDGTSLDQADNTETISGYLTEWSTSGGELGVEALNVMSDQLANESRPDMKSVDLTLVTDSFNSAKWLFGTAGGTGTYTVYEGQDTTGSRTQKSVFISVTSGTNEKQVLLDNAYFTTNEFSLSADGYLELSMTAQCLLKHYYEADK